MASRKAIITGAATAGALFAAASDDPANTAAGGEGEWVNVLSSADVEDGRRLIFSGHRAARSEDDLIRAAECDIEAHDASRGSLSLRGLGLDDSQAKKLVDLGSSLAEDPVSSLTLQTNHYKHNATVRALHYDVSTTDATTDAGPGFIRAGVFYISSVFASSLRSLLLTSYVLPSPF